jgi:sec-independent protein translocase protein TatC
MITPTPEEEAALEKTKAPLLEHLIELRSRLLKSIVVFFVAFIGCYFLAQPIYAFLVQPLYDAIGNTPGRQMIATGLPETFFTYVKLAMFGGICLAFPYIAAQLWAFVAPGLYKQEQRAFLPFLAMTPVMFLLGAAFVYYLMMPYAIQFFLSFETPAGQGTLPVQLQPKVSEYLSFVMTLIFAFGLCFELPVLLTLLGRVGIISSKQLISSRRYAVVGIFLVAAVITPPDAFSMLALAFPLVALYEISILCVKLIERKRDSETAAKAAAT